MMLNITIREILQKKGASVYSLSPDHTVFEAIALMSAKNIGSVLVMHEGQLVGIMTERDYTRKVILEGRASKDTPLHEIMSSPVVTTNPDNTVENCMRLVTLRRARHLPVLEEGKVIGIISIGDLVKAIISAQNVAIEQLEGYLSGKYPA